MQSASSDICNGKLNTFVILFLLHHDNKNIRKPPTYVKSGGDDNIHQLEISTTVLQRMARCFQGN
jgi:hypothetical protein